MKHIVIAAWAVSALNALVALGAVLWAVEPPDWGLVAFSNACVAFMLALALSLGRTEVKHG